MTFIQLGFITTEKTRCQQCVYRCYATNLFQAHSQAKLQACRGHFGGLGPSNEI